MPHVVAVTPSANLSRPSTFLGRQSASMMKGKCSFSSLEIFFVPWMPPVTNTGCYMINETRASDLPALQSRPALVSSCLSALHYKLNITLQALESLLECDRGSSAYKGEIRVFHYKIWRVLLLQSFVTEKKNLQERSRLSPLSPDHNIGQQRQIWLAWYVHHTLYLATLFPRFFIAPNNTSSARWVTAKHICHSVSLYRSSHRLVSTNAQPCKVNN